MNNYPGYEELHTYIQTENPTFRGFVKEHAKLIMTDWKVPGLDHPTTLMNVWKSRFSCVFSQVLSGQQPKRTNLDKRTWHKLYYEYNSDEQPIEPTANASSSNALPTSSPTLSSPNTGLKRKSATSMSLRMKDFTLEPANGEKKWKLNETDFSSLFAGYQAASMEHCLKHDGSLKMSKDINELLSLSGILLLENDKLMSEPLLKHFTKVQLKDAYNQIKNKYDHIEVEPEIIIQIIKCLEVSDSEERDFLFLTLRRETKHRSTKKAIEAIQSLVSFLPEDSEKDINEYTLASTVVHPLFMPLFREQGVNPLPCNGLVHESSRVDNSRPDFRCDVYEDGKLSHSNLFGEVKSSSSGKEGRYLDLYRILLFSKNTIDKKNKKNIMSFRVVGQQVVVYMLDLWYDKIYIAVELYSFFLPALKSNATMLVSVVEKLINIHNIYVTNSFEELSKDLKKSSTLPYGILLNSLSNTTEL